MVNEEINLDLGAVSVNCTGKVDTQTVLFQDIK